MEKEDFQYRKTGFDKKIRRNRRSSILKESNTENENEVLNATSKTRNYKRVSFADTTSIKEFLASRDTNTVWNSTYEEPMTKLDLSTSMEITTPVCNALLISPSETEMKTSVNKENRNVEEEAIEDTNGITNFLSNFLGVNQHSNTSGSIGNKDEEDSIKIPCKNLQTENMEFTSIVFSSIDTSSQPRTVVLNSSNLNQTCNLNDDSKSQELCSSLKDTDMEFTCNLKMASSLNSKKDVDRSLNLGMSLEISDSMNNSDKNSYQQFTVANNGNSLVSKSECEVSAKQTEKDFSLGVARMNEHLNPSSHLVENIDDNMEITTVVPRYSIDTETCNGSRKELPQSEVSMEITSGVPMLMDNLKFGFQKSENIEDDIEITNARPVSSIAAETCTASTKEVPQNEISMDITSGVPVPKGNLKFDSRDPDNINDMEMTNAVPRSFMSAESCTGGIKELSKSEISMEITLGDPMLMENVKCSSQKCANINDMEITNVVTRFMDVENAKKSSQSYDITSSLKSTEIVGATMAYPCNNETGNKGSTFVQGCKNKSMSESLLLTNNSSALSSSSIPENELNNSVSTACDPMKISSLLTAPIINKEMGINVTMTCQNMMIESNKNIIYDKRNIERGFDPKVSKDVIQSIQNLDSFDSEREADLDSLVPSNLSGDKNVSSEIKRNRIVSTSEYSFDTKENNKDLALGSLRANEMVKPTSPNLEKFEDKMEITNVVPRPLINSGNCTDSNNCLPDSEINMEITAGVPVVNKSIKLDSQKSENINDMEITNAMPQSSICAETFTGSIREVPQSGIGIEITSPPLELKEKFEGKSKECETVDDKEITDVFAKNIPESYDTMSQDPHEILNTSSVRGEFCNQSVRNKSMTFIQGSKTEFNMSKSMSFTNKTGILNISTLLENELAVSTLHNSVSTTSDPLRISALLTAPITNKEKGINRTMTCEDMIFEEEKNTDSNNISFSARKISSELSQFNLNSSRRNLNLEAKATNCSLNHSCTEGRVIEGVNLETGAANSTSGLEMDDQKVEQDENASCGTIIHSSNKSAFETNIDTENSSLINKKAKQDKSNFECGEESDIINELDASNSNNNSKFSEEELEILLDGKDFSLEAVDSAAKGNTSNVSSHSGHQSFINLSYSNRKRRSDTLSSDEPSPKISCENLNIVNIDKENKNTSLKEVSDAVHITDNHEKQINKSISELCIERCNEINDSSKGIKEKIIESTSKGLRGLDFNMSEKELIKSVEQPLKQIGSDNTDLSKVESSVIEMKNENEICHAPKVNEKRMGCSSNSSKDVYEEVLIIEGTQRDEGPIREVQDKSQKLFDTKELISEDQILDEKLHKSMKQKIPIEDEGAKVEKSGPSKDVVIQTVISEQCCQCFCPNHLPNSWFPQKTSGREGWIELRIRKKPWKIFLDVSSHENHQLIMRADWGPKSTDLKKYIGQFVMKIYENLMNNEVEKLIGVNVCSIGEILKDILQAYERATYFHKMLFLIETSFLTKFNGNKLEVTIMNLKGSIVRLFLSFSHDKTDNNPVMKIRPHVIMGNFREKDIEDIVAIDHWERNLFTIINRVDDFLKVYS